jgi:hypothetical protein
MPGRFHERRQTTRWPVTGVVAVVDDLHSWAQVCDLSLSGFSIRSLHAFAANSEHRVKFLLESGEVFCLSARMIHCSPLIADPMQFLSGWAFRDDSESRRRLALAIIRDRMKASLLASVAGDGLRPEGDRGLVGAAVKGTGSRSRAR